MKLIYVASPYAGYIERNTEFAREACQFEKNEGHAFFAPHLLYPQVLHEDDPADRRLGLAMGKEMLSKCDELWAFGDFISPGMAGEVELAEQRGIPVRYITVQEMEKTERSFAERHPFCSMRL